MSKSLEWKPMCTVEKKDGVVLLGTTDTQLDNYSEFVGYYDKEMSCFTTEDGWAIAAVAWKES